jgi:hypothetical protein
MRDLNRGSSRKGDYSILTDQLQDSSKLVEPNYIFLYNYLHGEYTRVNLL